MTKTATIRTRAHLTTFLYRAVGDLDATAKNARTDTDRDHAERGRKLAVAAFKQLGKR